MVLCFIYTLIMYKYCIRCVNGLVAYLPFFFLSSDTPASFYSAAAICLQNLQLHLAKPSPEGLCGVLYQNFG